MNETTTQTNGASSGGTACTPAVAGDHRKRPPRLSARWKGASKAARIVTVAAMGASTLLVSSAGPADAALRTYAAVSVTGDGEGYKITSDNGENYDFGTMTPQVNPTGFSTRIVDAATTADGRGTLELSNTGQLYASGTARAWPNPTGFSGDMVALAMTADGQGAVAMSSEGQLYAYGSVNPQLNPTGFSGGMVDVTLTADGQGLLAVSGEGQFYAYGTAKPQPNPTGFSGGMRAADLTADGQGLLAVSGAGQFYAYGTAKAQPNPTGFTGGIVDVDLTANGQGAVAVSGTGQAYAYGNVIARGNADPGSMGTGPSITPSGNAQLARQLLDMRAAGRIAISDYSASPVADRRDRSLASQQLEDIAAGRPVHLSTRCTGQARTVQADTRVLQFLVELGNKERYTISTLFGQCHSTNSTHYRGLAVDFECGVNLSAADAVGSRFGIKHNFESCAVNKHWHYSVGGN